MRWKARRSNRRRRLLLVLNQWDDDTFSSGVESLPDRNRRILGGAYQHGSVPGDRADGFFDRQPMP